MKLYLSKDIKKTESYIIDDLGVYSLILMEHAAYSVYEEIVKRFDLKKEMFLIAIGKGNNGGDAYALARMLLLNGANVSVFEVLGEPQTADALIEKDLLKNSFSNIKFVGLEYLADNIRNSVLIDGIFGIGFKGELSKELSLIFEKLNLSKYIVSIDIPSGLDSNFGKKANNAISADLTISFILYKQGLFLYPASLNVGEFILKKLYFPIKNKLEYSSKLIDKILVKNILNKIYPRQKGSHKGNFGRLGIVAAAKGMEGAISISALGALKSGAGVVSILAYDRTIEDLRNTLPKISMDIIIEDIDLVQLADKLDVIIVGPGFSRSRKTTLVNVVDFALKYNKKLIFDADALNIASADPELLSKMRKLNAIFTPHPKEMANLTHKTIKMIQSNRLQVVQDFVEGSNITLVLKGANTVIVDELLNTYISPFAVPALAGAGTGDFLSGIIAGFVSQGLKELEASIIAVYLHALAGTLYAKEYPDFTMNIEDLATFFVKAIQYIYGDNE